MTPVQVDSQKMQIPIPNHITMTHGQGVAVPPLFNNFFITWSTSYTLSVRGAPYLVLNNQKKHSLRAPAGAASGLV
jgi:hypothetical protein